MAAFATMSTCSVEEIFLKIVHILTGTNGLMMLGIPAEKQWIFPKVLSDFYFF